MLTIKYLLPKLKDTQKLFKPNVLKVKIVARINKRIIPSPKKISNPMFHFIFVTKSYRSSKHGHGYINV